MSTVYILIELPKQKRNRDLTNLRRYLKNHEFNQLETDCPMKVVSRLIDPEPDYYEKFTIPKEEDRKEDDEPIVKESTHQDLLENWARQTFSENSAEMKLLFDSEHDTEKAIDSNDDFIDEKGSDENNSRSRKRAHSYSVDEMIKEENLEQHRLPKRSLSSDAMIRENVQEEEQRHPSVHTISSDSSPENFYLSEDSDTIVEDYDEKKTFMGVDEDMNETKSSSSNNDHSMCDLCDKYIRVGRCKRAVLRAQLYHIIGVHSLDSLRLDNVNRRYQCESCYKNLSAYVSPCDHINNFHTNDDAEIKFNDKWSEEQISECNQYLKRCFRRCLPVPRARRVTNGFSQKSNYVINSRKTTDTGETSSTTTLKSLQVQKRSQHVLSSLEPHNMSSNPTTSSPRKFNYDFLSENGGQDSDEEDDVDDSSHYPYYL